MRTNSDVKSLQRNVWKWGQIRTLVRICLHFHTFLRKFFTFLNACISVKTVEAYGVQFGINCTALDQSKLSNFVECTIISKICQDDM